MATRPKIDDRLWVGAQVYVQRNPGLTITAVVNLALAQFLRDAGIPFNLVDQDQPEQEISR